jgi:hypothetical protein
MAVGSIPKTAKNPDLSSQWTFTPKKAEALSPGWLSLEIEYFQ